MIPKPKPRTKIMVFGTFDILHKGHINFFRQARKLSRNPFLIVSVARDVNVKKIKGAKPVYPEKTRLSAIKKGSFVDKAVLGGSRNYLRHIIKEKPNILALGYDQKAYTKNLKELLAKKGLRVKIIRLKSFQPEIFKSSLIKKRKFAGRAKI